MLQAKHSRATQIILILNRSRISMMGQMKQGNDESDEEGFDMQMIGNFLSFASRGDRVGLNQMLRKGTSPNVQDYDKRTALHLAASEGHAPIVELLLHYKANVNLKDRWQRTPLTDARLYGHRDICRILEVNGGKEFINDQPMTVRNEQDSIELNFDISELNLQHSSNIEQGVFGESQKVKWRGTWVAKTVIKRHIHHPVQMILSAKDNSLLLELRHPNILEFLGSIVHGEEMVLITEYLPQGNLDDILKKKIPLDLPIALRYALDIARGMNYLHEHKPFPIVHNHLDPRNLLQDEGGDLKIGEYWVQMLYKEIQPNQDNCQRNDDSSITSKPVDDTKKDIQSFGFMFYQMLEGRHLLTNTDFDLIHLKSIDFEPKFQFSRRFKRIQQLIEHCTSKDPSERPSFAGVIEILEEVSASMGRPACPVC
ncbi:putative serine-threonine protein kinase [Tripterygium wilfordii]|uniref:Putative serine-threonine protein kinase n=1 Tax=Tripterygium wilfordii TaxID=458696 RepID=A0A7J7DV26_TRIWF|nr:integrin-linked protein kinase 1-like isoform X2 [Tripterygium wilfordii]KAF5749976.1 putative serine-threonine protein kinase [Tripterygium wilfordii]